MDPNQIVGGYGKLDPEVVKAIGEAIKKQDKLRPFEHGSTAAFWHVIGILNSSLKK